MSKKVMLLIPSTSTHLGLFDDINSREDVLLFETGLKKVGKLGLLLRRVHFSRKINQIISLPLKGIWYRKLPIEKYKESLKCVVIIDGALNNLPEPVLYKIKKRYPCLSLFLFMINSIEAGSPIIQKIKPYILSFPWNGLYTFDPKDAQKYNMHYKGFCYYSKHNLKSSEEYHNICDVYFIGGIKGGREREILEVYDYLSKAGLKCSFNLMQYGDKTQEDKGGLHYFSKRWRPYEEVLEDIQKCNCILEILQHGQSGPSLRYFEAICYNKKLLTNNSSIVNFPYYNSRFMHVFTSLEEIDVKWIKDFHASESVEYSYQDDFSPNTMIDFFLGQCE